MKPDEPVSKNDAAVLLRAIQRKTGKRLVTRDMPKPARRVSQHQTDRVKAAQMLAAEILAAVERCEALEREA